MKKAELTELVFVVALNFSLVIGYLRKINFYCNDIF
jgi:hypothetical protein